MTTKSAVKTVSLGVVAIIVAGYAMNAGKDIPFVQDARKGFNYGL